MDWEHSAQDHYNLLAFAKREWPQVSWDTRIATTRASRCSIPVLSGGIKPIWEDCTLADVAMFDEETIELNRVSGLGPIIKIGYGPRSDTLVIAYSD